MTLEEFCALPMEYRMGLRLDTCSHRLYRNDAHGVQKEVITPFNPRTLTWGKGKVYFYLDGDGREFRSARECWQALAEKQEAAPCP